MPTDAFSGAQQLQLLYRPAQGAAVPVQALAQSPSGVCQSRVSLVGYWLIGGDHGERQQPAHGERDVCAGLVQGLAECVRLVYDMT